MSLLNTNKNLLQKPIKSIKKPLSAMKIDWKCFTFDFYPFSLCFNPISFSEWPDRLRTMKLLNILSFENGTYPTRHYIFWWICATCKCSICVNHCATMRETRFWVPAEEIPSLPSANGYQIILRLSPGHRRWRLLLLTITGGMTFVYHPGRAHIDWKKPTES